MGWFCCFSGGGGGGVTLIFSYIRRLGPFFGVQNFEFQYFFLFLFFFFGWGWGVGFRKMIFWNMKILLIFFGGHHKIGLYFGVISMHFRVFSKGQ